MSSVPYILGAVIIAALVVACVAVCKRYNGFTVGGFIAFFPKDYPQCPDRYCKTCDELCLKRGNAE